MNRQPMIGAPGRQQGVAILAVTMSLLLVATIGTLMVGRVGLQEQKIVGTDVRSKEVYSAAIGGLEYGSDWFEDNWEDVDFQGGTACGQGGTYTPTALANASLNADDYIHSITYTALTCANPDDGMPVIVRITSVATADDDSHIQKTISKEIMLGTVELFNTTTTAGSGVFSGPPILIEGCMDSSNTITGQPDIIYNYPTGVAVGTTGGLADADGDGVPDKTLEECIDIAVINNHLNLCNDSGTCEDADDMIAGGGEFRDAMDNPQSLWVSIFGDITEAELKEQGSPDKGDPTRVLFVDSGYPYANSQPTWNGNTWHADVGTATKPVILYFDSSVGCPPINGSTVVYGLVYFETVNCGNQGWGGGTIYGTVAKAGDLSKLNANAVIIDTDLDFGNDGGDDTTTTIDVDVDEVTKFTEIPGSWRDF